MAISDPWDPVRPDEVGALLSCFDAPWWIAGGWALELFAGRRIRDHGDLDIEIARSDILKLPGVLSGWDFQLAHSGELIPWDGKAVELPFTGFWTRPDVDGPWRLQVMLATVRGDNWYYRRDERITRPLADIGLISACGSPIIAPEIQLLYKSTGDRPKDDQDFDAVAPLLTPGQRAWLRDALLLTAPEHRWLPRLRD